MKIVIDISENIYECVKKSIISDEIFDELVDSFRKSKPLSKGHGRLIDAEEVKRKMGNLDGVGMIGRCIDEFPTIIEADKEELDADSN